MNSEEFIVLNNGELISANSEAVDDPGYDSENVDHSDHKMPGALNEESDNSEAVDDPEYLPSSDNENDHSDHESIADSVNEVQPRRRKRRQDVDKTEWMENKRARLRERGQAYYGIRKDRNTGELS